MDFKSLAAKKVLGIPVLYLAAAAVVVFLVWAWQMKGYTSEEVTGDENTTPENVPESEDDIGAADYQGLTPTGTVTVVQPAAEPTEAIKQTNDDWLRAAVTFLIEERLSTPGEAQVAINNYLEGNDLTYEQGQLRDAAIKKLGVPPERISVLGSVGNKTEAPAQRQFSAFPGKHTVKGPNDNSAAKLAALYYGSGDATRAAKIAATNHVYGTGASYNVGTVLSIPAWREPAYYTVTKTGPKSASGIAAKNAISVPVLQGLNPGKSGPYTAGTKLRVS